MGLIVGNPNASGWRMNYRRSFSSTDEFNTINYLFVTLALDDRNILFTTPHLLCSLVPHELLPIEYVDTALTYYVEIKGWMHSTWPSQLGKINREAAETRVRSVEVIE